MAGKQRKRWTAADKLRIVLAGTQGDMEVSELCRREGINPTQYYGWRKQLLAVAGRIFANDRKKPTLQQQQRLESENQRLKAVVAELTAENLEQKKALGLKDYGKMPVELQKELIGIVGAASGAAGRRAVLWLL